MVSSILSLFLLVSVVSGAFVPSAELKSEFEQLAAKYGRKYETQEEYNLRLENFAINLQRLKIAQENDPKAIHRMNKFFDLSKEEFDQKYKGFKKASPQDLARSCLTQGITAPRLDVSDLPTSFDWRQKGVVTPVKNQGGCGSCWAFSTTGNIESQWAIAGHKLVSLSEQEIVDCSHGCTNEPPYGKVCNSGCGGGWPWIAYSDLISMGGLEAENVYPYTGEDGVCTFSKNKTIVSIRNYTCLSSPDNTNGADEDQMAAYLVSHGPLSIALDAEWLQTYFGGVSDPWLCDSSQLDHAVLIVGYGQETDWFGSLEKYWIVKNSWGEDWGESGYFRIIRGSGKCGLNYAVSSAIV